MIEPPTKFQQWIAEIPFAMWAFLIVQLISVAIWGARQDYRLTQLERDRAAQDVRVDQIDMKGTRALQVIDERQRVNTEAINELKRKTDWLIQIYTPHVAPPGPYRLQSEENK